MNRGSQGIQGSQGHTGSPTGDSRLLTIDEAAALLGYCTKTIRRQVKAGRIPAVRLPGGNLRFDRHALLGAFQSALGDTTTAANPASSHIGHIAALADELTT